MTMNVILFSVFIAIFVATAIITLCSLPDWIKIPENYRKALFSALIIEVVACVILLFRETILEGQQKAISHTEWVGINSKGELISPLLGEEPLGLAPDIFTDILRRNATYDLVKEREARDTMRSDFVIRNESFCLGKVSLASLSNLSLFDGIDPKDNEFKRFKFSFKNEKWKAEDTLPEEWPLAISMNGSKYSISDTSPNSNYSVSSSNFNADSRSLHFFKASDNAYYLVRISDARLRGDDCFVTFLIIRLVPTLNGLK